MKEHVQDYGVRKWAGDDLIELQAEPLSALQALVAPYAPCILTGCELETVLGGNGDGSPSYRLHAGYVALKGRKTVENGAGAGTEGADTDTEDAENGADAGVAATAENGDTAVAQDEEYVKIVRVTAQTVYQPTVFLALACTPVSRAYGNGENKAIAYDYTAEVCDVLSDVGDRPYLTLVADANNPRLPDTLGITRKLGRDGGEAKDVVVTFTDDGGKDAPEDLQSGLTLGLLISRIKKWLGKKVDKKDGYGLSKNDFDDDWMQKLEGIKPNANNYSLPLATDDVRGGVKIGYSGSGKNYPMQLSNEKMYVHVPWTDTNTDTIYTHPTGNGNNHIPSDGKIGQYLKWSASGTATWATPTASEIGAASTAVATSTSNGLMSAADKSKLNGIKTSGSSKKVLAENGQYVNLPSEGLDGERGSIIFTSTIKYGTVNMSYGWEYSRSVLKPSGYIPIANKDYILDTVTKAIGLITYISSSYAYVKSADALKF